MFWYIFLNARVCHVIEVLNPYYLPALISNAMDVGAL